MKINEKNLCMFATTPPVDLEGWLNKRGELNKSWQRRWFVLKGNLLFYFEKRTDKEPLGMIILEGCTVELAEESEQYCFQIIFHGPNNRTYFLSTESQSNMEQWMKALTCAGYDYMKLMVAELQRQLDEIEGGQCRERTPEGTPMMTAPPKAPPRRQNPFNKPLTTEYASNADTGSGEPAAVDGAAGHGTPATRTGRKAPASDGAAGQHTNHHHHNRHHKEQPYGAELSVPSSSAPVTPSVEVIPAAGRNEPAPPPPQAANRRKVAVGATKSSDAIANLATRPLERGTVGSFSFEAMHSALGGPVLADLSKWNASRHEQQLQERASGDGDCGGSGGGGGDGEKDERQ
uniref:PH domain-containing protein n=1 Tax=Anopheles dirus TaxID=7168 RepID=A0A182N0C6_9DIPT